MPDPWFPGAVRHYGRNAGYASGRTAMRAVVCHYTVGRNSDPIGVDGYFHWLVRRNGEIVQYAECDATTWHAGEWNGEGPGVEIEHYPPDEADIFTPAARDACGELVRWLRDEWGFPGDYHDGARLAPGTWRGFISHRSLQQSEQHSDYWPAEDFAQMVAGGGGGKDDDDVKGLWIRRAGGPDFVWLLTGGYRIACGGKGQVDVMAFMGMTSNGWDDVAELAPRDFDEIPILEWRDFPGGRYVCGPPE